MVAQMMPVQIVVMHRQKIAEVNRVPNVSNVVVMANVLEEQEVQLNTIAMGQKNVDGVMAMDITILQGIP